MLSKLAVGTDGSDSAWRAVGHAARLAEATGAELLVVHAFGGAAPDDSPAGDRDVGASLLRDVTAKLPGHPVQPVLRQGDAADVLVDVAARESADVIVVGNRGMSRRRAPIGNVPNRIAHRSPCSVLIAQTTGDARERTYDRVLIASDGSPTAERAVEFGGGLASSVGAETLLVHVGDRSRGDEILAHAARRLPAGLETKAIAVEGDPAERIVALAAAEDCDLIVTGNRGMTGLRRFLASVPSRVAHAAPCHLLLVKTT